MIIFLTKVFSRISLFVEAYPICWSTSPVTASWSTLSCLWNLFWKNESFYVIENLKLLCSKTYIFFMSDIDFNYLTLLSICQPCLLFPFCTRAPIWEKGWTAMPLMHIILAQESEQTQFWTVNNFMTTTHG